VGSFLVSVGTADEPLAIGVASSAPREIEMPHGVLGVEISEIRAGDKNPRIGRVMSKSAAERAQLHPGDVVLQVNGVSVLTPADLSSAIARHSAGDVVRMQIQRDDKTLSITAILDRYFPDEHAERREFQESLGSRLSDRREGFPSALQHDTVLRPEDCGSPLLDLDGRVVGINIARAGRTASYAIPTEAILRILPEMLAGKLAPKPAAELVSTRDRSQAATSP
jgi:serine protease Do